MRFPFEIKEIRAKSLPALNKKVQEIFTASEKIINLQKEKSEYILFYLDFDYEETTP